MTSLTNKLILSALLACALPSWAAIELKGARFSDTYQVGAQALQLNGAGIRVKVIVDVYAAGLYVVKKDHTVAGLLGQNGPKSLQIVLLRDLTGEDFAEAMIKGFTKNNSAADIAKYQSKLDEVRTLMVAFGAVKKGTNIHIDNAPGAGISVLVDGVKKGPDVGNEEFYAALLKIWLGNSPVDSDLKDALLGSK